MNRLIEIRNLIESAISDAESDATRWTYDLEAALRLLDSEIQERKAGE